MKTVQVSAASVISAAGSALKAGNKAGQTLRDFVGFTADITLATHSQMVGFEARYKLLLADNAYLSATDEVKAKVRRLMTDAVRSKAGYSVAKDGAISVKVKASTAKGAQHGEAKKGDSGQESAKAVGNAEILQRAAQLGNTFLPAADKAHFAECIALILSKLATATASKKAAKKDAKKDAPAQV